MGIEDLGEVARPAKNREEIRCRTANNLEEDGMMEMNNQRKEVGSINFCKLRS